MVLASTVYVLNAAFLSQVHRIFNIYMFKREIFRDVQQQTLFPTYITIWGRVSITLLHDDERL